ncbi:MAG: glycoside hydrolase family 26 protein [Planctomycetota bacterium]|jgi:beta-mannanase
MRARQGEYLTAINAGKWDAFFRQWAIDAKAEGGRVLMRFGFEMNGEWFTWSGRPKEYIEAWRRVHRIMHDEVGAENVEWVWAPNVMSVPKTPENGMHHYYPGDEVVDWVGIDGYNFGENHDEWHRWESFEEIFRNGLDEFEKRYPNKPIMIAETGCAPGEDGQRVAWIRDAYAYLHKSRPSVRALVWFHYDKRRENEPDWRIDKTPESLRAFNETFARPAASR